MLASKLADSSDLAEIATVGEAMVSSLGTLWLAVVWCFDTSDRARLSRILLVPVNAILTAVGIAVRLKRN